MKKQLLLVFALFSSFMFIQCNEDNEGLGELSPDKIARFLDGAPELVVPENSADIIEIPVFINYDSDSPVEVKYEIEGDTSAFEMLSEYGVAVVPAGERTGKILIKPIDNSVVNDPNLSILIRILGSNGEFASPSGVSIGYAEKMVTLEDDECPIAVSKTFMAQPTAFGESAPAYTATLTPVTGSDNEYEIDSAWGPDFVAWATGNGDYSGQYVYSGVIKINADNSITVTGNDGWATGGTGTFTPDPAGKFQYTLSQGIFTSPFTVSVVLTGNCD